MELIFGGTHIAVGVISERNTIIGKREMDIAREDLIEDMKLYIIDHIKILIGEVLRDVGAPSCVISKIGIAIPGRVKNKMVYDIYNLGIDEFDIADILSKHYGIEVTIRNDAKCAALAEKTVGSIRDYEDCVFLSLGTGIGGATFIDGKMLEYTKEWGSEYGHMIIKENGIECRCGNRGCWERYASMKTFRTGLIDILKIHPETPSKELLNILKDKINVTDTQVENYINEYLDNLIVGISNIVNIIGPEVICLGGSFVYYEEVLYGKLIEKMNSKKFNGVTPKIVLASLQNDAGMIGSLM